LKSQYPHEEPRLSPPTNEESHRSMIEWNYISVELRFVFGFGIVMGPLMFWKRWRIWYYKLIDDILFKIFPNYILEMNIVEDHHSTISSRGISCSYDQREHLWVCHENLLVFFTFNINQNEKLIHMIGWSVFLRHDSNGKCNFTQQPK
jgi:hypothetical protein